MNREKAIKGLECCAEAKCEACPYEEQCFGEEICTVSPMAKDMLELLKAQEPQGTPEAEWLLYKGMRGATCSYCKRTFDDVYDAENYDYYCRHCGAKMIRMRTVKWDG